MGHPGACLSVAVQCVMQIDRYSSRRNRYRAYRLKIFFLNDRVMDRRAHVFMEGLYIQVLETGMSLTIRLTTPRSIASGQLQGQCHRHTLVSHMFLQFCAVQYKSQRWLLEFKLTETNLTFIFLGLTAPAACHQRPPYWMDHEQDVPAWPGSIGQKG